MSLVIPMANIQSEAHLKQAIRYVMQEYKTKGMVYSNSGVTPEEVIDTFMLTKRLHPAKGKRQGYHYKFSFSKDETISKEDALAFVKEWAEEYLGDNYDYVVSAHSDREHMHMHLIFNATKRSGGKYHYQKGDKEKYMKPLTNRLCQKYHTGLLKEKDKALDYSAVNDWKKTVQKDMDRCLKKCKSYPEFKKRLQEEYHYLLREGVSKTKGVYWSLTPPGKGKAIRSYQLDVGYMPADIEKRIKGEYKLEKKEYFYVLYCRLGSATEGRCFPYVPYQQLSVYQQHMVKKMLEARRLYNRTNTSLQMHERSKKAMKEMMQEAGIVCCYNICQDKDFTEVEQEWNQKRKMDRKETKAVTRLEEMVQKYQKTHTHKKEVKY